MRAILVALAMLAAMGAEAAERTYAAMSLVGDGLLIVNYRVKTGSSLSSRQRQAVPVADPVFDRTALIAVEAAVKRAQPKAEVVLFGGRDAALLELQAKSLGAAGAAQAIADA